MGLGDSPKTSSFSLNKVLFCLHGPFNSTSRVQMTGTMLRKLESLGCHWALFVLHIMVVRNLIMSRLFQGRRSYTVALVGLFCYLLLAKLLSTPDC